MEFRNRKETEEFIIELCKDFDEETRKGMEYWKGERKISPEHVLMAKFGFLELAYEKGEAIERAKKIIYGFFYKEGKNGGRYKTSFKSFENNYDIFLELFKYDNKEELYLQENDILLKRNKMLLELI